MLAFFIHTKESKLQKGKHNCIFVYTLQMLVACHCEWKKRRKKEKQMPLQKGKCMVLKLPYNGQNTLRSDRSFMYHQRALHAPYAPCALYRTYVVWLKSRKRNRKWWALFRLFLFCNFVTSLNSLFVVGQTNKQTKTLCEIVEDASRSVSLLFQMYVHSQVAKLDRT